jgi:6-phosphogluconolactonase
MQTIKIYPDPHSLAQAAAARFIQEGNLAIQKRGRFTAALSGGSTPQMAYEILAAKDTSRQLDWSKIHLFWGDERCVPPEHPESNFRMANEVLLKHLPIPDTNIHRMEGENDPHLAAVNYQVILENIFGATPRFDLICLGMGADGHTASLFPGQLDTQEIETWTAANYVEKVQSWRLTLTPAVINQARNIVFLVSGDNKADTLKQVLVGEYKPEVYPSQMIKPSAGKLSWYIDQAASSGLDLEPDNIEWEQIS